MNKFAANPIPRHERIAKIIQQELAKIMIYCKDDPNLRGVTVTKVKVSKDLALATVFVVTHEDSNQTKLLIYLEKQQKQMRSQLAKNINLRITPKLKFIYDDSLLHANKILKLLDAVDKDNG
jgi:ribosome-binding factor A